MAGDAEVGMRGSAVVLSMGIAVVAACNDDDGAAGGAGGGAGGAAGDAGVRGAASLTWRTTTTAEGYVTDISGPGGSSYRVTWATDGGGPTVRLEPSGGRPAIGPVRLDSAPADADAAERAAFLLYRADVALNGAAGQPFTGLGITSNHAGCDDVDVTPGLVSCGRGPFTALPDKGGCCDVHDACISERCTGCGDSGNIVKCLAPVGPLDCSDDCTACHRAIVACFLTLADEGDSSCCARDDCGQPQRCMIDDVVITDAAECETAGIATDADAGVCP